MKKLFDGTEVPIDTPTKSTSKGRVLLTQEEITARQAEEAKFLAEKPMKDWQSQMGQSDTVLPRWAEDIIDAMNPSDKAKISQDTLDKHNAKKDLRASKPN